MRPSRTRRQQIRLRSKLPKPNRPRPVKAAPKCLMPPSSNSSMGWGMRVLCPNILVASERKIILAKVMIVDDDRTMTSLMQTLLELDGYQVVVVSRGGDVIAKA